MRREYFEIKLKSLLSRIFMIDKLARFYVCFSKLNFDINILQKCGWFINYESLNRENNSSVVQKKKIEKCNFNSIKEFAFLLKILLEDDWKSI